MNNAVQDSRPHSRLYILSKLGLSLRLTRVSDFSETLKGFQCLDHSPSRPNGDL